METSAFNIESDELANSIEENNDFDLLPDKEDTKEELDFPVDKDEYPAPLLTDVMIDLETLSTKPGAAVISIAAIMFDLRSGKTGPTFIKNINIKSNVESGRDFDPNTLSWWVDTEGPQFARWCEIEEKVDLLTALAALESFLKENTLGLRGFQVWGNSNRFDLGILADAYESFGWEELPWQFYGERDVRTLASLHPEIKNQARDEWTDKGYNLHDPLVDCRLQISYCSAIYNKIKPAEVEKSEFDIDLGEELPKENK